MNALLPPELICRPLPAFDINDWNAIEAAFADAPSCAFQQAWLETPEADFQPATVRVGWQGNRLWVYGELGDVDIFNDATHLNDATYAKGDIFEIFVRPEGQDDYYEFHTTPENHNLQLHWPDNQTVWGCEDTQESLAPYFTDKPLITSNTQVQRENNLWRVIASVPADIAHSGAIEVGDVWNFSFSRYDCTRGRVLPVWSASSPHAEPRFHRQQEWGKLTFSR
jgi:hypothetical protein